MQDLIDKAGVLIEALPYIQRFRESVIVIKFGGSAMEEQAHAEGILADMTFMECVGMRPVVVHGGGKAISKALKDEGVDTRFVQGLRVTCERSIEVVERVMSAVVNPGIVSSLVKNGARACSVHGQQVFKVNRKQGRDEASGEALDWGFVGDPHEVDVNAVQGLLDKDTIPVVSPLGIGSDGKTHNINADTAAAAMAKALKAAKLVYLTDVPGLMRDPNDPDSVMSTLKANEVESLVDNKVIDGGMLPKVGSGVDALHAGVGKIHIIDGRMPHSLLLEIFTDKGVGTQIVHD